MKENNVNNKEHINDMFIKENKKKILIFLLVFLVLAIIITFLGFIFVNKRTKDKKIKELNYSKEEFQRHEEIAKKIKDFNEVDRAKIYLADIINNLQKNNFKREYSKLYKTFKQIFFNTEKDYEEYIKREFPSNIAIKHNNYEMLGEYTILFVDIIDQDGKKNTLKNMKFIFKEESLDNYIYSFSVMTQNEDKADKEYEEKSKNKNNNEKEAQNILEKKNSVITEKKAFNILEKVKKEK